jgi:hypothetical protein
MILGDASCARLANNVDRVLREDTSNPTSPSTLGNLRKYYKARQEAESQDREVMP